MNKFDNYAWIEYYNKRNKEDLKRFETGNVYDVDFYLYRIKEGTKRIKKHIKMLKKAERKEINKPN